MPGDFPGKDEMVDEDEEINFNFVAAEEGGGFQARKVSRDGEDDKEILKILSVYLCVGFLGYNL